MWEVATPGPDYEMLRQRCCMRSQVELRLPPEPIAPTLARAAVAAFGSACRRRWRPISNCWRPRSSPMQSGNGGPGSIRGNHPADRRGRVRPRRGHGSRPSVRTRTGQACTGPERLGTAPGRHHRGGMGRGSRRHRQEGLVRTRLRPRPCYEMCENSVLAPLAGSRTSWASRWRFGINPSTRTRSRTRRTRSCSP